MGQGSPLFAQSCSEGCVPTGHTHTVIKGEGGMTFTVHSRTQPVGWTVASSPQALGCNIISLGTTHWPTQTLLQVQGLEGPLGAGRAGHCNSLPPLPAASRLHHPLRPHPAPTGFERGAPILPPSIAGLALHSLLSARRCIHKLVPPCRPQPDALSAGRTL